MNISHVYIEFKVKYWFPALIPRILQLCWSIHIKCKKCHEMFYCFAIRLIKMKSIVPIEMEEQIKNKRCKDCM